MNLRISRIFLIASLVLLVLSGLLLSVAGNYWPWFATIGACALVPAVAGPRWYRFAGIAIVVLSGSLVVSDVMAGIEYRKRFVKFRARSVVSTATSGEAHSGANGGGRK
jgi:hypothetical protein